MMLVAIFSLTCLLTAGEKKRGGGSALRLTGFLHKTPKGVRYPYIQLGDRLFSLFGKKTPPDLCYKTRVYYLLTCWRLSKCLVGYNNEKCVPIVEVYI